MNLLSAPNLGYRGGVNLDSGGNEDDFPEKSFMYQNMGKKAKASFFGSEEEPNTKVRGSGTLNLYGLQDKNANRLKFLEKIEENGLENTQGSTDFGRLDALLQQYLD